MPPELLPDVKREVNRHAARNWRAGIRWSGPQGCQCPLCTLAKAQRYEPRSTIDVLNVRTLRGEP